MRILLLLCIWQVNAQNVTITSTASQQATPSNPTTPSPLATISPESSSATPFSSTVSSTPSAYSTTLVSMTPSPTPTQGPTATLAAPNSYKSPLRNLNMEDWFTIILPPAIVITVLLLWIYNIRKKNAKLKWIVSNYRQSPTTLNNPTHSRVKELYTSAV